VLSVTILVIALAAKLLLNRVWVTPWAVGGVLLTLTILRVGEDEPL
jgi:hypothetical protein